MTTIDAARPSDLDADAELRAIVTQFLALEAKLLDECREEEWYNLLDEDLLYTIPIRQAAARRSLEVDRTTFRVRDTIKHIRARIDRLNTGHAYAETPPSRTLRVVGSIHLQVTDQPGIVDVASAVIIYRQRGIDEHFDLIPVRRNDRIRLTADGPRLLAREVLLTEVALRTSNLALFL